MKKITIISVLLASVLAFYSCENFNPPIEIPLSSVVIELDDIEVANDAKGELNSFSTTQNVSYSTIVGLTEEALNSMSRIESIDVNSLFITITSNDEMGTVVEDFVIKVDQLPDFTIDQYLLGTSYTVPNIGTYASQLLMKILSNESVDINLSGKTDVTSGENLKVTITLNDVILVAKVLNI